MNDKIRSRQIHLDFHTSEHIKNVGAEFNAKEFTDTLQEGNVNSVTLFARCHHGWCYYPTKVGKPHPNLVREDLLGEMINACQKVDIATPLYLTVQWDELIAREHPEWRVMNAYNTSPHWPGQEPSAMNQLTATWHTLCIGNSEYVQYLIDLASELIDLYDAEGFFMDILGSHECVCPRCLARMQGDGLDPEKSLDRQQNDRNVIMDFFKAFSSAVKKKKDNCRIFFNSGHIYKGERDRYEYYSHLELESLPTGGWGYDHFPISARYADTLGMDLLGMTGKFHGHWGEFGGFKRPEALEYECSHMISLGTKCSIGDQLHPSGKLDPETYKIIAPAYERVKKLEPYLIDSKYQSEIAILSCEASRSEAIDNVERISESDTGAARMLLELKYPFDVIDTESDLADYRLLILPDEITLDENYAAKIQEFLNNGGKILHSAASGMNNEKQKFLINSDLDYSGQRGDSDPDYIHVVKDFDADIPDSPIVMYSAAYIVKSGKNTPHAQCFPSFFNRRWDHFCSHLHAPFDTDAESLADGIIETENGFYFSHEIFKLYYMYGQPIYKYMVRGAIEKLITDPLIKTNLPSAGRLSVLKQSAESRYIVNLLYAPTQNRGSKAPSQDGRTLSVEIIEDVPELVEVKCSLKIKEKPLRIYNAYTGKSLPWMEKDGYLILTIPKLYIHNAIVIEYK